MKPTERQKLCPNCDGNVPIEAAVCPYCAADLSGQTEKDSAPSQAVLFKNQSLQESLASLYTPPYSSSSAAPSAPKAPVFKEAAPKRAESAYKSAPPPPSPTPAATEMAVPEEATDKASVLSILLLSLSGVLLTLGLIQFFFSNNGVLRLEWDASYWFIYCLGALPLFYFGYKKLQ